MCVQSTNNKFKSVYDKTPTGNLWQKFSVASRGISFHPSSNNTPSSPPYHVGSKIKALPEEKYNEELPTGIVNDSSFSTLVVGDDLKMGDMSGGIFSMNNHTLYQQYCDSNNGDVSSRCGF